MLVGLVLKLHSDRFQHMEWPPIVILPLSIEVKCELVQAVATDGSWRYSGDTSNNG